MFRLTSHLLVHTLRHTTPMRKAMGDFLNYLTVLLPIRLLPCLQLAPFAKQWPVSLTVFFVFFFASLLAVPLHFDSFFLQSMPPAGTNVVTSFGACFANGILPAARHRSKHISVQDNLSVPVLARSLLPARLYIGISEVSFPTVLTGLWYTWKYVR